MARPKTYDRQEALSKAQNAFWQYGYESLGVRAIETETGLNRFAIQTDFGGKEGLFREVLEKYTKDSCTILINPLRTGGLEAIRKFFYEVISPKESDQRVFGCLMVNTVVENAAKKNIAFKALTDFHFDQLTAAFAAALVNARSDKQLRNDIVIKDAAAFLLCVVMGIQVCIRMNGLLGPAQQQTKIALQAIESWRVS